MPWTESRTREEWLAEVRRRGERMRRRRRLAVSAVCALALMGPAVAVLMRTAGGGGDPQLVASGDVRFGAGTTGPSIPAGVYEGDAIPTTTALAGAVALPEVTAPSGPLYSSTTTAVPRRGTPVSTVPPADDPVIRATTVPSAGGNSGGAGGAAPGTGQPGPMASLANTAPPEGAPAPCTAAEFKLTLTIDRTTYAPGDRVKGASKLEKQSAGTCQLPGWTVGFKVLNDAGKDVYPATRSYTTGHSSQPAVGPGTVITDSFEWEACADPWPIVVKDSECVPFPSGTYTVIAEWSGRDSGPPARATFQLGP